MISSFPVINIPDGEYEAIASAHTTVFKVNDLKMEAKFENAVKGFDIPDVVTVKDGKITSKVLGSATPRPLRVNPQEVPDGDYPAIAGGYVSRFEYLGRMYRATFETGIRGMNYPDTVTVSKGKATSLVLQGVGKIVI